MRRTRPKGDADPGWVRISWDEALAETANRLRQIRRESGAEAVAFGVTTPSGTPMCDSIEWVERFIRLFGSPNTVYGIEVCNWHKDYAHMFTFGCGMPTADYARSDLMILWGHNPANVWLSQATAIGDGQARGAKLMVIDPRCTALAARADLWLRVRPGADAALALGLSHLLLAQEGYDEDFVRGWTNAPFLVRDDNGRFLREDDLRPKTDSSRNHYLVWDDTKQEIAVYDPAVEGPTPKAKRFALRGRYRVGGIACRPAFQHFADACAEYTPERVARITWIPESDIRAAARIIREARSIAYHAWTGVGQHTNATQTERAMATLYALTGSFDVPGGNVVWNRQRVNRVNPPSLLPAEQLEKALGVDERPLGPPAQGWITARDLYKAILEGQPYQVRAMMAFGGNPVVSHGDVGQAEQAFASLEFHVHCDLFETPTTHYADIVLPVNTPWEREGLRIGFEISAEAEELIQLRQRMVPPRGESRSDNDIVFDLAMRMGMEDEFFGGSLEAGWNHILQPLGLDVETLRKRPEGIRRPVAQSYRKYADRLNGEWRGFATETRRVELYSEKLTRHGYAPVPVFVEPADSPVSQKRFPYVLSSAKSGYYCHSQHRSLASLRKRSPVPVVEIHPGLAASRNIRDGDWCVVSTRAGSARFEARLNDALDERVLVAEYGWWQACEDLGQPGYPVSGSKTSNFNALISADQLDTLSGSSPFRSVACEVALDPSQDPARRPWEGYRPFRVAAMHRETADVMRVAFEAVDGGQLPDYRPGQHLPICVDLGLGHGEVMRVYSLTGAAQQAQRTSYGIAVKRVKGGLMSSHIVDGMRLGDVVGLKAPGGHFVMPAATSSPVVLIAAGIGITPFISYLETLRGLERMPEVILHYANQNSGAHAFARHLKSLQAELARLSIVNYYDQPLEGDRLGVDYDVRGRISSASFSDGDIARRARFYMCGPAPMMDALTEALAARGVHQFEIFKEEFRSPVTQIPLSDATFDVYFSRSKRRATWRSTDGSLLAFGEALGVAMPSGCRVGQCESCEVAVLRGKTLHLSPMEAEDGRCFACQAIPLSDVVLDV